MDLKIVFRQTGIKIEWITWILHVNCLVEHIFVRPKIVRVDLKILCGLYLVHTIQKVNSILTKPQQFHEFFTQNFFDNFSRQIKVVDS